MIDSTQTIFYFNYYLINRALVNSELKNLYLILFFYFVSDQMKVIYFIPFILTSLYADIEKENKYSFKNIFYE